MRRLARYPSNRLIWPGKTTREKLKDMAEALVMVGADMTVLTDPSSLAWTFNIRGQDVPHTPVALGFAIIRAKDSPLVFIDLANCRSSRTAYLNQLCDILPPETLLEKLAELAPGKTVALDPPSPLTNSAVSYKQQAAK